MAGFNLDEYIDVAERIAQFKEAHPEGTLQRYGDVSFWDNGGQSYAIYTAAAYRTPDDQRPGIGTAWEKVPGTTPYTKDSELMNAETAAWGRAIVALGFATKKIASKQEVQARQSPSEKSKSAATSKTDVRKQQMPLEVAVDLLGKLVVAKGMDAAAAALAGYGVELPVTGPMEEQSKALQVLSKAQAKALVEWANG